MKKLTLFILAVFALNVHAQVTTTPAIIQKGYKGEVIITFNPKEGNAAMAASTACYAHIGLITKSSTSGSDWKYATSWQKTDPQMTKVGDNWQLTITPDIYSYYKCPESEEILKLAFVFHDGKSGGKEGKTKDGGDIYVSLVDAGKLAASITASMPEISTKGQTVSLQCNATSSATLELSVNGSVVKSGTGTELNYTHTLSMEGNYSFEFKATSGNEVATASAFTCVPSSPLNMPRPSGVDMGIYYDKNNTSKVTLCTFAAACKKANDPSSLDPAKHVFVVGDFNDWTISNNYQMNRDGNYFWIEINNLTPQTEYAFQYVVVRSDGKVVRISDLFSEKLLHPDDKWEPKTVDPTLKDYPSKGDGYVTVIETGKPAYNWQCKSFTRPNKNNLVIYELWVGDFTPKHDFEGLLSRLDYLKDLGVNAVELMPVTEFDGNQSWGYSPNHYFAIDKAYGTPEQLKLFVDECHQRGIAVILDMVFNHATGLNPMNKLYPYGTDLKYNPWFNVSAPHPDNVYEDWNHDFAPAHSMFIRALKYWIEEYHVDGYRMDLSHGLCGKSYNAVTNLKDYYENGVKAAAQDAYFILEHWGNNMGSDRPQLVNAGMMCWQNTCNAYEQTAMGWLKDGDDLSDANMDNYVSYSENHDEERSFFKAKQWGDGQISSSEPFRCHRIPLNMAFLTLLNGPQLFYMFNEVGYDFSKFQNMNWQWGKDNTYGMKIEINEEVKMSHKVRPESMGWFKSGVRMTAFQQVAQIIQLRTRLLPSVFEGNPTASTLGSGKAVRSIQWGSDVYVVGNFNASTAQTITLPSGTWYDYLDGGKATASYTLQGGDVKVFTGSQLAKPSIPASYDEFSADVEDVFESFEQTASTSAIKQFRNGELIIIKDGVVYNAMGMVIE